ncbi:TetR/AcrR family transcriptional regulator [Amycolatopsis sp. CA-230715]|uniref:TetR/AcrR family transcriptional regulator n=1 Tax=Amycolatopsis sp. CA-230715 TaxID=2745196 RepID=UPI001C0241E7|nr:TetR/AcrR family transcriptional regulator [Amycolatopsis sp. CA-230715]QWF83777.1 hypothetical protein HUW46_07220 [Amycolatopsis sp. CA-230715]
MTGRAPAGLRDRKKAKTKVAIQEATLRLFAERGYEATTVEQVTQAAGVSRATYFRYFASKADVVLYDVTDMLLVDALRALPCGQHPVRALREAAQVAQEQQTAQRRDSDQQREYLMRTVPELRAKVPEHILAALPLLAAVIAERHGRDLEDLAVRTTAGAIIGVAVATWTVVADDLSEGFAERHLALVDTALQQLEDGLPL